MLTTGSDDQGLTHYINTDSRQKGCGRYVAACGQEAHLTDEAGEVACLSCQHAIREFGAAMLWAPSAAFEKKATPTE